MSEAMVSVLCAAYNHEKYIKDALEGFVKQKTSFEFEVLVNDDASTDHTADIIREYARRYPHIIKPLYQKENQYSQNVSIMRECLMPRAKGKYFALCEGDDFWTDPQKLQKQVDYMESHPECTLCIHNGIRVKENGSYLNDYIVSDHAGLISTDKLILGGGGYCPTNSIFAPTRLLKDVPDYFNHCSMDFVLQFYLASMGTAFCFADKMSAYRVAAEGSWTERMKKADVQKRHAFLTKMANVLGEMDAWSDGRYHDSLWAKQSNFLMRKYILEMNSMALKNKRMKQTIKMSDCKTRIVIWMICYSKGLYKFIAKRRNWEMFEPKF